MNSVVVLALIVPMVLAAQAQRAAAQEANRAREVATYDSVIAAAFHYAELMNGSGLQDVATREARADFDAAVFSAASYATSNAGEDRARIVAALDGLIGQVDREEAIDRDRLRTLVLSLVVATCRVHNDPRDCAADTFVRAMPVSTRS